MKTMDGGRLSRFCLVLALISTFPLAASAATPDAAPGMPGRFDAAVAAGLPVAMTTRGRGAARAMAGTPESEELIVRSRLESRSTYSDGTPVEIYDVQFRGHDALALRHGTSLRIAAIDDHTLRSTTFKAGEEHPVEMALPVDSPSPLGAIDEAPEHDVVDALAGDKESRDLHVFAFVHDDVRLNDDELFERFFAWWIKRMEFDVLEDRRTHVHLRRDIPGVTNPSYGYKGALFEWIGVARGYTDPDLPDPVSIRYIRNILLVQGAVVEPGAAGIANGQPGDFAMASTRGSIAVPAHEIGHLIGASHDHAERRYAGPFSTCDTIMYPVDPTVVCKAYSLPNVDRIRRAMNYLRPR